MGDQPLAPPGGIAQFGQDQHGAPKAMAESLNPPADVLAKFNPFHRKPKMQGRHCWRPLRRLMMRTDPALIDNIDMRLAMLIKMGAAFGGSERLDIDVAALKRRYPDHDMREAHMAALSYLQRYEEALSLAKASAQESPHDPQRLYALIQAYMVAGHPEQGIEACKQAISQPGLRKWARQTVLEILTEAGEFDWITNNGFAANPARPDFFEPKPETSDVPIYCISLDRDHLRLKTSRRFLETAGDLHIVNGVLGSALPYYIRDVATKGQPDKMSAGEIGCAISHFRAWERIADELDPDEYALVTEDDARFIHGPGVGLAETIALARQRDAGLVFVNDRSCRDAFANIPDRLELLDISNGDLETLTPVDRPLPGWGGDGYLLSAEGARALIQAFQAVGHIGAVDWQMQMMSYPQLSINQRKPATRTIYDGLIARGEWPVLPGWVSTIPIISFRDFGVSAINSIR